MNIKDLRKKYRMKLKKHLLKKTGCNIQHAGFPCGTCFFELKTKKELTNEDWQLILWIRGDYNKKDLINLPKETEYEQRIKNILEN